MKIEFRNPLLAYLSVAALFFALAVGSAVQAQDQQPAADNTKKNQDQSAPTADQQKMNPSDRAVTQKIRKAIHQDSSLSSYAHNIKIITQGGKVTLKGPVRSEDERANLEAKAVTVAGQGNVTNQIEIAPSN